MLLHPSCLCRKSWLVPTQYLLGLFMLYLSMSVNSLLQSEGGPQVVTLTAVFFMLAFLAATQVANRDPRETGCHTRISQNNNPCSRLCFLLRT